MMSCTLIHCSLVLNRRLNGSVDAIFTLRSTDRSSSVYIASLDIRKAFDRVNHYKLYKSLLHYGVPVIVVDILCNWYSKLKYCIKWNCEFSHQFEACSGVRQESCLLPAVFNVFMNVFITVLKCQRVGRCITSLYWLRIVC